MSYRTIAAGFLSCLFRRFLPLVGRIVRLADRFLLLEYPAVFIMETCLCWGRCRGSSGIPGSLLFLICSDSMPIHGHHCTGSLAVCDTIRSPVYPFHERRIGVQGFCLHSAVLNNKSFG